MDESAFNTGKDVKHVEDLEIIELYFARDERAIKETDAKYGKLCYNIAYNVLNNREDSEECVNDTLVGVWNAIPPTRPDNFMLFVCGVARNLSLKRLEFITREKRRIPATVSLDELEGILSDDEFIADMNEENVGKLISAFLHEQKNDVRNVFIRKYYFFDSVEQIAKRYSFTQSKVKNMLFHTRNKLRKYLIKEGIEL